MGAVLDVIGAIEAAYDDASDDMAWLERMAHAVAPALGADISPTTAFFFDMDPAKGVKLGALASVGDSPFTRAHFVRQHSVPSPDQLRFAFQHDMLTLLSSVAGRESTVAGLRHSGMTTDDSRDSLGLRANVTPDHGVLLTALVPWGHRLSDRALWERLAAHIGSALRLRRLRGPSAAPEDAAAILTPTGKLEHGTDHTHAARDDLREAAKSIDRARGKLRRLDRDEASSIWRAMVRAEWSLVDWFDHDGKRFLLAHDNHIGPTRSRELTKREHQAVACAAMGHSNKLIAYDLGISTGAVSKLLARAASKLGVATRPALVRAFRDLPPRD